ncbi:uncharacterized protein LOC102801672 [Saccoglossus kowalevskii]|uniref:Myosin heavy chain, non-muscle-like n=1 Tax=Saccoglossus kowalevskii TaxID=10224 RepID=A0ABM0MCV7_SACKO|nr:PREDICTED: myosin heavy chain, non-muscle-like [Saccoglossus kowalevskii]
MFTWRDGLLSVEFVLTIFLSLTCFSGFIYSGILIPQTPLNCFIVTLLSVLNGLYVAFFEYYARCSDRKQVRSLREKNSNLNGKRRRLNECKMHTEEENQKLRQRVVNLERDARTASMTSQLNSSDDQSFALERAASYWEKKCKEAEINVSILEADVSKYEQDYKDLSEEKLELESEKHRFEDHAFLIQERECGRFDEMNVLRKKVIELQDEIELWEDKYYGREKEVSTVIEMLREKQVPRDSGVGNDLEVSSPKSRCIIVEDGLLEDTAVDVIDQMEQLVKESGERGERIRTLETEKVVYKGKVASLLTSTQAELKKYHQMYQSALQDVKLKDSNLQEARKLQSQLLQENNQLKHMITEIRIKITEESVRIKNESDAQQELISTLQKEVDVFGKYKSKADKTKASLVQKLDDLTQMNCKLKEENSKLSADCEEIEIMRQKIKKLESLQTFKLYVSTETDE